MPGPISESYDPEFGNKPSYEECKRYVKECEEYINNYSQWTEDNFIWKLANKIKDDIKNGQPNYSDIYEFLAETADLYEEIKFDMVGLLKE